MNALSSSDNELSLYTGELLVARTNAVQKIETGAGRLGPPGILFVTNFRIGFSTTEEHSHNTLLHVPYPGEDHVPFSSIWKLDRVSSSRRVTMTLGSLSPKEMPDSLEIQTKDFRLVRFSLRFAPRHDTLKLIEALLHYAFPVSTSRLFAFDFDATQRRNSSIYQEPNSGNDIAMTVFSDTDSTSSQNSDGMTGVLRDELKRLRQLEMWRISLINENFLFCPTLSSALVCPASVTESQLELSAKNREGRRVPVWSWSEPGSSRWIARGGASLSAAISSDPCEDPCLKEFKKISSSSVRAINLQMSRTACGVTLPSSIGVLRESFKRLYVLCVSAFSDSLVQNDNHWNSHVDTTHWLEHVRCALRAAIHISNVITIEKESVLLLEGSTPDAGCVLCSLALIMLDTYFRTREGFRLLITKEWLGMGYPFSRRMGHVTNKISHPKNELAPSFHLFLDCVWQLIEQFPLSFEFNSAYLVSLADRSWACMHGTFLFDSNMLRTHSNVSVRTQSVWPLLEDKSFENPLYNDAKCRGVLREGILIPSLVGPHVHLWNDYYLRWSTLRSEHGNTFQAQNNLFYNVDALQQRLSKLKST